MFGHHLHRHIRSHTLWTAVVVAVASAATGSASAQEPFSLEQVLGAAFPTGLVADQDRGAFARVMNEAGARNIWVSEPPSYVGRRVTSHSTDDGQEVGSLRFTADGRLLFVRGGPPNRQGASPMASVDTWRSPVLLIHGDDDRNVPFSESVDLVEALQRRGVVVEQLIFPDEVHSFLLHRSWLAAFEAAADFLNRKLGPDPKTTADAEPRGR